MGGLHLRERTQRQVVEDPQLPLARPQLAAWEHNRRLWSPWLQRLAEPAAWFSWHGGSRAFLRWRACRGGGEIVDAMDPGSSFLAREKAFLSAFFCQSGTVRIPCLRSLCTYNFLKSVHF